MTLIVVTILTCGHILAPELVWTQIGHEGVGERRGSSTDGGLKVRGMRGQRKKYIKIKGRDT